MAATHPKVARRDERRRAGARAQPAPPVAAREVPPLHRDPWALAVVLALVPLLFAMRGAAWGEPFADDFLFIDHTVIRGNHSWLDGGGFSFYWRPLARQLWFGLMGPAMLTHPACVAAAQAVLLGLAGVLLHRALRTAWPAPAAAVAGAFPIGMEAARLLVTWASAMQDLGALVLLALALHATSRGRTLLAVVASVGAALCKEVATPLAFLVAIAPLPRAGRPLPRASAMGAGLLLWLAARLAVQRGLGPQHYLPSTVPVTLTPLERAGVTVGHALLDAFGLAENLRHEVAFARVTVVVVLVSLAWALARSAAARQRALAWSAWGLAWFACAIAPLALLLPDWAPFRSIVPAMGLGVALVAPLAELPLALAALAGVRLAALLAAPQPPERVPLNANQAGSLYSYPRMALLQHVVQQARVALTGHAPRLERNGCVVKSGFPRMVGIGLQDDLSLRAWYRDTTVRWIRMGDMVQAGSRVDGMLVYEPDRTPQFVAVDTASVRAAASVYPLFRAKAFEAALSAIDAAEAASADTTLAQYHAVLSSWRAMTLIQLGRLEDAEHAAARSQRLFPGDRDARYLRATAAAMRGDWATARRLLAEQLALFPDDANARALADEVRRRDTSVPH